MEPIGAEGGDAGPVALRVLKLCVAMIPIALLLIGLVLLIGLGVPWLYREWLRRILDNLTF